jgi:hypothetical protein
VAGVVVGMTTTFVLLLLPASDRGDAHDWGLWRRLRFLSIIAGVSAVLLLPAIVTSSKYAPVLTVDDVTEYPEAGPGGRYGPNSRAPYKSFFDNASTAIRRGFIGAFGPARGLVGARVDAVEPAPAPRCTRGRTGAAGLGFAVCRGGTVRLRRRRQ